MPAMDDDACPLCGRPMVDGPSVNRHHLVPKTYRGRETHRMHRICHGKIHAVLTERELRDAYASFERLRAHPEIARFVDWVRSKPPEFVGRHRPARRR